MGIRLRSKNKLLKIIKTWTFKIENWSSTVTRIWKIKNNPLKIISKERRSLLIRY